MGRLNSPPPELLKDTIPRTVRAVNPPLVPPDGTTWPSVETQAESNSRVGTRELITPSYFLTRAAMQLISTKEFPGSAATATVVRAGPPFGK
jgi:hypothetical protein